MKVYKDIESFTAVKNAVVTTGTFDGLHNGHRVIISRVKQLAKESKGQSVIVTFYPHPQIVLHPEEKNINVLTSQEEKIMLFEQLEIDHLIFIPFTPEFSKLSYTEFIKNILIDKLHVRKLVIGYDHHFGKDRQGELTHLQEYGKKFNFEVEEIGVQKVGEVAVSSTKIRKALLAGDVVKASKFLGYKYFLSGHVVKGESVGRTLGFPTANIEVSDPLKLIPGEGVYVVSVEIGTDHQVGMLSIGTRPTFNGVSQVIEVNIFNFNRNIYYEALSVHFIEKLRDEVKYDSVEELKEQLLRDKQESEKVLLSKNWFV